MAERGRRPLHSRKGVYIKGHYLSDALQEALEEYREDLVDRVNEASEKAVKDLAKRTRATAPAMSGDYRKRISSKRSKQHKHGSTYVWYVKDPDYRLTHLLVHGHATRNGGRTKADPFLANALADVLPAYEEEIKEAIQYA